MQVTSERPNGVRVVYVHKLDDAENVAAAKGLGRKPEASATRPPVSLYAVPMLTRVNPEPTAVGLSIARRSPSSVLNILAC